MTTDVTQNLPSALLNLFTVNQRTNELPAVASWTNGANYAGGGSGGIGIAYNVTNDTPLTGDPASWTLLDQHGAARDPQDSQYIGGAGLGDGNIGLLGSYPMAFVTNPPDSSDGGGAGAGDTGLLSLATGWVAVIPPP